MVPPMSENPILDELHGVRSQILLEHGANLAAYLHREFERLKGEGHPVVRIQQRTIRSTEATSGKADVEHPSSPSGDR